MEPIKHTRTARLGLLKMYREDLDQLIATFYKFCEKVIISDTKYRYESLEEMKQNVGPRIKDFDIRGENPGVRCLFNQTEVVRDASGGGPPMYTTFNELRTEEITSAADGLFFEIKDFLLVYQQPTFRKAWIVPLIVSAIGVFWFAIRNSLANDRGQLVVGWATLGLLASVVLLIISFVSGLSVRNYLSLETKRNSPSFFARNREEFAKHTIVAVISGVVGAIIGYFLAFLRK